MVAMKNNMSRSTTPNYFFNQNNYYSIFLISSYLFRMSIGKKFARKVFYSGVQPSGQTGVHLGNYIGALRHWQQLQDNPSLKKSTFIYSIADLHAMTDMHASAAAEQQSGVGKILPSFVDNNRMMTATLLACGIKPERSIIYRQSSVPQHTQLMWLLSCMTGIGRLQRMNQFRVIFSFFIIVFTIHTFVYNNNN
jgi:hypothetical protein